MIELTRRPPWAVVLFVLTACPGERVCPTDSPKSYATDIAPLLTEHCVECHDSNKTGTDRKQAPELVNYDTYAAALAQARNGNRAIFDGTMPVTYELSDEQACAFRAWVRQGMPP